MRRRDSRKVLKKRVHLLPIEMFEQSHALTRFCPVLGGKGGNGFPSAISVTADLGGKGGNGFPSANSVTADLGGKGGNGFPSATSVPASIEDGFGRSDDMGQPSALIVRSIVTGLPAGSLTDRTTGSTIKTAKTGTATASIVFFKGVSLLTNKLRRDSFGGVLCLKMFRMRNRSRHEHAYAVPAKPQSHSGLHPDDSGGNSRAICPADLHRFLAGSLQRPI